MRNGAAFQLTDQAHMSLGALGRLWTSVGDIADGVPGAVQVALEHVDAAEGGTVSEIEILRQHE